MNSSLNIRRFMENFDETAPIKYTNKAELVSDVEKKCNEGMAFLYVPEGEFQIKPTTKISDGAVVYVKQIAFTGKIEYYKYLFEEVKYDSLCFGEDPCKHA